MPADDLFSSYCDPNEQRDYVENGYSVFENPKAYNQPEDDYNYSNVGGTTILPAVTITAPASSTTSAPVVPLPYIPIQQKLHVRAGAGEKWTDATLSEWPENDFRLFVGDLGNEVTTEMLAKEFQGKYKSFVKAKVVRGVIPKRITYHISIYLILIYMICIVLLFQGWNMKSSGYGFLSFLDAFAII